jgi:hypothetical protein
VEGKNAQTSRAKNGAGQFIWADVHKTPNDRFKNRRFKGNSTAGTVMT